MSETASLQHYYAARAPEYDRVYQKPERQADLRQLQQWLPPKFQGTRLLEIACGTGYWTQFLAPVVMEGLAIDAAASTLQIAAERVANSRVHFALGDAYALPTDRGLFNAAFAGFWYSHIPKARQCEFLRGLAEVLQPGARVVLLDNLYVPGSSTPICEHDAEGNTYQLRPLADGSVHRVLKNFPVDAELQAAVAGLAEAAAYTRFEYFWAFEYFTSVAAA